MKTGYLIDMDGVIYRENHLVPGAADFVQALTDSGQVIPAEVSGGLLDIQALDFGIDASAELAAMRALEDR